MQISFIACMKRFSKQSIPSCGNENEIIVTISWQASKNTNNSHLIHEENGQDFYHSKYPAPTNVKLFFLKNELESRDQISTRRRQKWCMEGQLHVYIPSL
mgnify:CR=1 FL=1